jgi:SAM-dependent methyltransferase
MNQPIAVLDQPAAAVVVDPWSFLVNGWVWLGNAHGAMAAVEAWVGDRLIGQTGTLYLRADVIAAHALPARVATGFNFAAQHKAAAPGESFELSVRARLRDGTRTPALVTVRLTAGATDAANPFNLLHTSLPAHPRGLEIGPHNLPTLGLAPFLTDAVASYLGSGCPLDFLADAGALPVPDDTLDYLCSSHVMEHLPNPIAALCEWHRVLRPGGYLYLVLPDKRFTFDAPRPLTPLSHHLHDFLHAATAGSNLAHADEFIYQTDWARLQPDTPDAEKAASQAQHHTRILQALKTHAPVDIHFHTFTPEALRALLAIAGFTGGRGARFDRLAEAERFPMDRRDGIGFLLRKRGAPSVARPAVKTWLLPHVDPAVASLPLVCPVTLSPLREQTDAAGVRALVSARGGPRYVFQNGQPSLLPPAGAAPQRPWSRRTWRAAWRVGAWLREKARPPASPSA